MFRDQKPKARRGVADLIGQLLADAAFNAERIAVKALNDATSDLGCELFAFRLRTAFVKFFFEARIP